MVNPGDKDDEYMINENPSTIDAVASAPVLGDGGHKAAATKGFDKIQRKHIFNFVLLPLVLAGAFFAIWQLPLKYIGKSLWDRVHALIAKTESSTEKLEATQYLHKKPVEISAAQAFGMPEKPPYKQSSSMPPLTSKEVPSPPSAPLAPAPAPPANEKTVSQAPISSAVVMQATTESTKAIADLRTQLTAQDNTLKYMVDRLNALQQHHQETLTALRQLKHDIAQQAQTTSAIASEEKVAVSEDKKLVAAAAAAKAKQKPALPAVPEPTVQYVVRAIVPGRAWLEGSDGSALTVRVGNTLPGGYGKVLLIDVPRALVGTSSGRIILFGGDDS